MSHIAIIGVGVTGVTTADALLERGFDVTLFDRNACPAMETSFANGGQLSASNAEVWTHWRTMLKGLRWLGRADAPLRLRLAPSWHKYSWLAEFAAAARHYERNTRETVRLALLARARLREIAAREVIDFDYEARGILHVYAGKQAFADAERTNALLCAAGLERHPVTPAEMRVIEPALRGAFHGGFFTPADATGDIHKFTRGLAESCRRRGARFVMDADVAAVSCGGQARVRWQQRGEATRHGEEFAAVVICAGVHSRRFASALGDRVNIYPVKGYSVTVPLADDASRAGAPWVSLLDDDAKIVTSRLGPDRFRVAGTAELNGFNRDICADRIAPLTGWVRRHFPQVETSQSVPWAGLRPMTPNMMPKVGPGRRPGVFYNTGHGHLGWTLCAATAEIVAETVAESFARSSAIAPGLPVRRGPILVPAGR